MKYLSLFSGIGGFEIGIQSAYIRCVQQSDAQTEQGSDNIKDKLLKWQQPDCIGYSEIDKYAIKVYERQFNGHKNYGNATTINATELPDFDLLVGGFPCQAFSIAGKRKGFDDTRGTLFFDIARILAEKRPRHLVLENVKGLLSHEQGKTFQTILGVLSDLGYRVEWQVLNSKDFGVPQNRERIYFIGHLRDECSRQVLPIGGTNGQDIVQLNQPRHSNDRVYGTGGVAPTLNTMQGGNRQPFIHPTLDANYYKGQSNQRKMLQQEARIRRLTPLECERLQGFPDGWTAGESDTQRYKMCGNAVTVNTVQAVMEKLVRHIV